MKQSLSLTKISMAFLAVTLLTTSCKKEGSESGSGDSATSRLMKVMGDDSDVEFTYDQSGKVNSITMNDDLVTSGTTTKFNVVYSGAKIAELVGEDQSRIVPQYAGSKIESATMKESSNTIVFTSRYSYQNDHLKTVLVETPSGLSLKFDFMPDASGNSARTTVYMQNPITMEFEKLSSTNYQHDSKTNPLYELRDLFSLFLVSMSKNNPIKEIEHDENGTPTETKEYAYTYNSKNLPKSAVVKTTPVNGAASSTSLTFEYQ